MDGVFRSFPMESIQFFRRVISFGFGMGILMTTFSLVFVFLSWGHHQAYDNLLRVWIAVRLLVFAVQLPLRGSIYIELDVASRADNREDAVQRLLWLSRSVTWRLNQFLGIFLYAWFGFAFLFIYAAHGHECSYLLSGVVIANIGCFFVHMGSSFFWFKNMLNNGIESSAMWIRGATKEILQRTTKISVHDESSPDAAKYSNCPICFEDFRHGDRTRTLPCKHRYHPRCIDPWLTRCKKSCPLCQRKIDQPQIY